MSLIIQFCCKLHGNITNIQRGLQYLNLEVERLNNYDVTKDGMEVIANSLMCNDDICTFNVRIDTAISKKSHTPVPGCVLIQEGHALLLKNMMFDEAEIDSEFHIELYAAQLGNKSIYIDLYQSGNKHVSYGAWYKANVIAGVLKPFAFSPVEFTEEAWRAIRAEMPGEIGMIYRITAKGKSYRYQVRGISESEVKEAGFTKPEFQWEMKNPFTYAINNLRNNHAGPAYVCSELIIPKGAEVDTVWIFEGGSVIVEEGGRLNDVQVFYGGVLEICSGANVGRIFELGGAVEGYPQHSSEFMTATFNDGVIEKDHFTTIHNNVFMSAVNIEGIAHAGSGSFSRGIKVTKGGSYTLYGGWHTDILVEKDSTLYICADAHVRNLTVEKNATVEIWEGAAIINGDIRGRILYNGSDLKNDPHIDMTSFDKHNVEHFDSCLDDLDMKAKQVIVADEQ